MTMTSIIILAGIIIAFVIFALVLAWGEYQTRNISQSDPRNSGASAQVHSLKQIALDGRAPAQEEAKRPMQQATTNL
jgi:hypothetical protein